MKGQTGLDVMVTPFVIVGLVIALATVGFIAIKVLPPIMNGLGVQHTKVGQNVLSIPSAINIMGWGVLLGVGISMILGAWVLNANPIFWGIGVLTLIFGIYFAMVSSNMLQTFGTTQIANETSSQLTFVTFISNNLVGFMVAIGIIALTLTYIWWKKGGEPQGEFQS